MAFVSCTCTSNLQVHFHNTPLREQPVAQRVGRVAPGLYLVERVIDKRVYHHYKLGPINQYKVRARENASVS
jgi:hypothetical protein